VPSACLLFRGGCAGAQPSERRLSVEEEHAAELDAAGDLAAACALVQPALPGLRALRRRQLGYELVEPTRLPDGRELLTPIVPVVVGEDLATAALWKALWDEGVYTNVALYPAVPRGRSLIRTSVMASHERGHLDRALEVFEKVKP